MRIRETHPNFKTFLFFIIVLLCGFLSVALALYLERYFPHAFNSTSHDLATPSIHTASFAYSEIDLDHRSKNSTNQGDIMGMITPPEEAEIVLLNLKDTFKTSTQQNGHFYFHQITAGSYEMIIEPVSNSGMTRRTVDLVNVVAQSLRDLGILQLEEYNSDLVSLEE